MKCIDHSRSSIKMKSSLFNLRHYAPTRDYNVPKILKQVWLLTPPPCRTNTYCPFFFPPEYHTSWPYSLKALLSLRLASSVQPIPCAVLERLDISINTLSLISSSPWALYSSTSSLYCQIYHLRLLLSQIIPWKK